MNKPTAYSTQTEVLRYLKFEKRKALSKLVPEVRNRHKNLPLRLPFLSIYQSRTHCNYQLNGYSTWIFIDLFGESVQTAVNHQKSAADHQDLNKYVDLSVKTISDRFFRYFFDRQGTEIGKLVIKGDVKIPKISRMFSKIHSLEVRSDEPIDNWFHVIPRPISKVKISGKAIYELLYMDTILAAEKVVVMNSPPAVRRFARGKLEHVKNVKFTFVALLSCYRILSEEILEFSNSPRQIGQIIEYYVTDIFNTKLFPNMTKIAHGANGKLSRIEETDSITIPMTENRELNVYIVPKTSKNAWILKMEVMAEGTALDRT